MYKIALALLFTLYAFGQQPNYYIYDGFAIKGYDVVSYFKNDPKIGSKDFVLVYDNAIFLFSNRENLNEFKANPKNFVPQYGGWCAYSIAIDNIKVPSNPKFYEIRDNKLYLFQKNWYSNKQKKWLKKNTQLLINKADSNWIKN